LANRVIPGNEHFVMTFWTAGRDTRLQQLQRRGLSAAEIAEKLGTTRNAVLGRSARLRGIVFRSVRLRQQATRAAAASRRVERKREIAKVLRAMKTELAAGKSRGAVIRRAIKAGATYQAIADALRLSKQRCHQLAKRS